MNHCHFTPLPVRSAALYHAPNNITRRHDSAIIQHQFAYINPSTVRSCNTIYRCNRENTTAWLLRIRADVSSEAPTNIEKDVRLQNIILSG